MAIHIRNCRLPVQTLTNIGSAELAFFMREAFLVGGWTENSNDGDADWSAAANIVFSDLVPSPGFAVLAANPRQVTHSGAPFTSAMVGQMVLALRAANDQNASMWRITEFVNTSTVKVDPIGFDPNGWVDESAIPGRILDYGSAVHTTGAWTLLDAPTGNLQARLVINLANYVECYARPAGQAADPTETPSSALVQLFDDDDLSIVMNAYIDDTTALVYKYADNDGFEYMALWGELENAVTGDTNPGFVAELHEGDDPYDWLVYMVGFGGTAQLGNVIMPKWYDTATLQSGIFAQPNGKLLNGRPGRAVLVKPLVYMTSEFFLRGNLPGVRYCNTQFEGNRPMNALGQWRHTEKGRVVPMNGPLDPPLFTTGV